MEIPERNIQMGDGDIKMRYFTETVNPSPDLPKYQATVHSIASDISYYSVGRLRQAEKVVIFHYTLSGEGLCYSKYGLSRVKKGQGFLSIINDTDSGYTYPDDCTEPWDFICLCFEGEQSRLIADRLLSEYGQIYTVAENHPTLQELIELGNSKESTITMSALESAGWAYSVYAMLIHSVCIPRKINLHPAVLGVRKVVADMIYQRPTVERTASCLGYSREYLCRLYKRETGKTIKEYIIKERINEACRLMKETELDIVGIANKLGFESQSNFSRCFKSVIGITPTEFRKSGRLPFFEL